MKTRLVGIATIVVLLGWAMPAAASSFLEREGVRAFIERVSARDDFNAAELRGLFEQVELRQGALDAIARPAEDMPWYRYRPIFITEERVAGGIEFLQDHAVTLARAEREYGVPPSVVTAILGVETFYGRHKGRYPVFDTLATLAFVYPPRADFFRSELEHFLKLARAEGLPLRSVKGSYAGAMGLPQFIASSYRSYAIDFDGDGRRDLWRSDADVIGSVAAYLGRHGWQRGESVVQRVHPPGDAWRDLLSDGLKPDVGAGELRRAEIVVDPPVRDDERVSLFSLRMDSDRETAWVGRNNFYVITRYNHSPLYAMAVHQLAARIRAGLAASSRPSP